MGSPTTEAGKERTHAERMIDFLIRIGAPTAAAEKDIEDIRAEAVAAALDRLAARVDRLGDIDEADDSEGVFVDVAAVLALIREERERRP